MRNNKILRYSILIVSLLLWLMIRRTQKKQEQLELNRIEFEQKKENAEEMPMEKHATNKSNYDDLDDLTHVSGIGPKISNVLNSAGITSYSQLAQAKVEKIDEIMNDACIRLGNSLSWIEQAKMLAKQGSDEEI